MDVCGGYPITRVDPSGHEGEYCHYGRDENGSCCLGPSLKEVYYKFFANGDTLKSRRIYLSFNSKARFVFSLGGLFFLLIILFAFSEAAFASDLKDTSSTPTSTIIPSPTPTATPKPAIPRQITREIELVNFHWAFFGWGDDVFICNIFLAKEGVPSSAQVRFSCGEEIGNQWLSTPNCETPNESQTCAGIYLKFLGELRTIVEETIIVPPPSVEVGLVNCGPWDECLGTPRLTFTGIELLENQNITSVNIEIGDKKFSCADSLCLIEMPTTDEKGLRVTYWAESSYGDQSEHKVFKMRNLLKIKDNLYQFELLGSQWAESSPPCALSWETFQELDVEEIKWLRPIDSYIDLYTAHPYTWLGGRLIVKGEVDASECADNGLLLNGAASTCGMEVAEQALISWQNQYDEQIFEAARENNLPANLLKGLIAQESQFYPQRVKDEYGLGMLTEKGADMLLTWNVPYFLEACVPLYGEDDCAWGYDHQGEYHQEYLRGLVFYAIGTKDEIPLIAKTISAACGQAGQLVRNITQKAIQETMQYSDLWQLTLGVYHAGSGCIADGIKKAWEADLELIWENIGDQLEPDCDLAQVYVQNVIYYGMP